MSRSFRYSVVDVFTRTPLEGNALAVFPDANGLDDTQMQQIARELNLCETVFVESSALPGCVKRLRIFTPFREMIFAGHPTIGAGFVLLRDGLVANDLTAFSVEEKIGPVPIRVEANDCPLLWLQTPPVKAGELFDPSICCGLLGLEQDELPTATPRLLDAGNPTLIVAVKSKASVDRASMDMERFRRLKLDHENPFCLFLFAPTEYGAYSRMFAPDYGIAEDPATGSSTGPLGAFMKRHGLLPPIAGCRYLSEQGTKMGRRSHLYFEISANGREDRILVGGHVTPVIEGTLTL